MNWVGGARNRLNRRNDKRIQEQFFEEKRKAKQITNHNANINQFKCSSPFLSQDILSFKRLSNVVNQSERVLTGCKPPKMARFVDLDNVKPRAQYINIKDSSRSSVDNDFKSSILCLGKDDDAKGFKMRSEMKGKSRTTFEDKVDFKISVEEDPKSRYLEESVIDTFVIKKESGKKESATSLVDTFGFQTESPKKDLSGSFVQNNRREFCRHSALVLEPEKDLFERFEEMKKKKPFFNLFD